MEAPHLKALQERYREDVQVLAVNVREDSTDDVRRFIRENELPYPVLLAGDSVFYGPYRGKYIPHTYIIDPQGTIRFAHLGFDEHTPKHMTRVIDGMK